MITGFTRIICIFVTDNILFIIEEVRDNCDDLLLFALS